MNTNRIYDFQNVKGGKQMEFRKLDQFNHVEREEGIKQEGTALENWKTQNKMAGKSADIQVMISNANN